MVSKESFYEDKAVPLRSATYRIELCRLTEGIHGKNGFGSRRYGLLNETSVPNNLG